MATDSKKTRTLADDDPRRAITFQPVLLLLIIGGLEITVCMWCNIQQIASTHDAVLALLQSAAEVPTHLTTAQVVAFLSDNLDRDNKIAYTIAFVTQIIFLLSAFPISFIHSSFAQRFSRASGGRMGTHLGEIRRHINTRRLIFTVFFLGDVWTDLRYATLNSHEWLVPLLYILAMWAGSTLVGLDGSQRLSGVWLAFTHAIEQAQVAEEQA